ncbi:hypothetical protein Efla_002672 [Eimeria flavescens]
MEASHGSKQPAADCLDTTESTSVAPHRSSTTARGPDADSQEQHAPDWKQRASFTDGVSDRSCTTASILKSNVAGAVRRSISSCASEPQLWRSPVRFNSTPQQQQLEEQGQRPQQRRRSSSANASKGGGGDSDVVLREACLEDLPAIEKLMKRHLRSLILPAVFYWLCRHAQDFGSFLAICCCFAPLSRVCMSLVCFLLLLLVRVVLELEQYAAKGCPDLANFESQYLKAEGNRFWVAEQKMQRKKTIVGCIGLVMHQGSPNEGHLVRLVVAPSHRGVGVGSRLLSAALGFAASCRCRSVEVCANSLNASSARFLRNRQFELVQVVKRKLMRVKADPLSRSPSLRLEAETFSPNDDQPKEEEIHSKEEEEKLNFAYFKEEEAADAEVTLRRLAGVRSVCSPPSHHSSSLRAFQQEKTLRCWCYTFLLQAHWRADYQRFQGSLGSTVIAAGPLACRFLPSPCMGLQRKELT